ncbi:14998_t:CDS:2, partial [Funneliformis geosporum]
QLLKKYEISSTQTKLAALKSFAKFSKVKANWERIIELLPKVQKKFFTTLSEAELKQLKAVQTEINPKIYQRNNLIFDFLFYTGIRVIKEINPYSKEYLFTTEQDLVKAREYKRLWIAKKRKEGKNIESSPVVEPKIVNVEPQHVKPLKSVEPCPHCLKSEKKVKELELKIISLKEINQILRKDLEIWQEPTSPYEKS